MAEPEECYVRLQSKPDNEIFIVERKVATLSTMLKTMLDDINVQNEEPIPVPNVVGVVLRKVLDWCEHYRDGPPELIIDEEKDKEGKSYDIAMGEWDKQYFTVDLPTLYDIILAANYLDIKGLLYQGCKHIADTFIVGQTVEQVRKNLGIQNDFTKEETEQLTKENSWCEN